MFVFNRSVFAVLAPLALLLLVALWSNSVEVEKQTVAATDRAGGDQAPGRLALAASNSRPQH